MRECVRRRGTEYGTYPLPRCNLFVGPDAGGVETVARGFMRDKGRLADDQRARYARTRGIMLDGKIGVRVLVVSPESGQGCHDYSVLEGDIAEVDGLEEFRCSHCESSLFSCWGSLLQKGVPFYTAAHR